MNKKRVRIIYWVLALGWLAFIYSTLSIVRPICTFLKASTPFVLVTNGIVLGVLLVVFGCLKDKLIARSFSSYVILFLTLSVYALGVVTIKYPEEKIHFIQYGLLAYLIYSALNVDIKGLRCYIFAFILVSIFGWIDEGIQYILPNRYYSLSDVYLNVMSGFLGLVLTYFFKDNLKPIDHKP